MHWDMENTDKRNTNKDCIVDSNSAMSKGKYVPVCKKNKPNVYSHVQVTGYVLGLPNVTTWDEIEKKMGARKSKTCADKAKEMKYLGDQTLDSPGLYSGCSCSSSDASGMYSSRGAEPGSLVKEGQSCLTQKGDENPIRTVGDYSKPSTRAIGNTIELRREPRRNNKRKQKTPRIKKVLIREEARFPVTKNVNSISLTKGEEEGSNRTKVTPNNAEKLIKTEMETPVMEVEKINEVENGAKNKSIKTSESEEAVEAPGIVEDVLVEVAEHIYPVDFMILDIKENENRPFILGTPFLTTAKASIKFDTGTITLRSGKHKVSFHSICDPSDVTDKGVRNDIEPIAPTMTVNRLVLEWEDNIKLHLEWEMQFNQWRSKNFKGERPTLVATKEGVDDGGEVTYFSFGRHLDELHVTLAHLEKERTRLRTNTKTLEDLCSQSLETASPAIHDAVTTHQVRNRYHIDDFNKLILDLTNVDIEIEDQDQALMLLTLFPSSYENFVEKLLYGRESLTMKDVLATLNSRERSFEKRWSMKKSSGFAKKGKHDQVSDSSNDEGNAYFGEALVVVRNEEMTELVIDSGGSYHMKHMSDFLYVFNVVDGSLVQLSDNMTCTINGAREVKIQLHDGSSFMLEDVWYVPGLRRSLISLGTLEKEGYTVKMQMWSIWSFKI
ncbi:zinc finger, CCHC-type containing protein [Tanacetum coccineum]